MTWKHGNVIQARFMPHAVLGIKHAPQREVLPAAKVRLAHASFVEAEQTMVVPCIAQSRTYSDTRILARITPYRLQS